MSKSQDVQPKWRLASFALTDAYTDFMLSRQAMGCSPATQSFYYYSLGRFLAWLGDRGVTAPSEVIARHVREYLATMVGTGYADNSVHGSARAIRTLVKFWYAEKYLDAPIVFAMPKVAKKRLPCLTAEQLGTVLRVCKPRDKAIVLLLVDSGLRRAEVIALNWGDIDMGTGLVIVKRGKGGKARSSVVGANTRRALLAYRRTLGSPATDSPVFPSTDGARFTGSGFLTIFRRLSKRTGIHVTPHSLRRTFVILSLRAGMSPLHLQALGGWTDMGMVSHYASLVDDDLLQAHHEHSPVDNLSKLRIK